MATIDGEPFAAAVLRFYAEEEDKSRADYNGEVMSAAVSSTR